MGTHMPRTLVILLVITSALACSDPKPEPPPPTVRQVIQQHARADLRPDSFSMAADRGRVLGDSTAPVWVVVVSDFQCEACKQWNEEVLPDLRDRYVSRGKVRVALLNRPLPSHVNAMPAALVATCAAAEGRFWQTARRIFATQSRWKDLPDARPFLDSLALASGVDSSAHRICSDQARGQKLVRNDEERTTASHVDSVPTFFIGTHRRVGATSWRTFFAVLDSAIAGK